MNMSEQFKQNFIYKDKKDYKKHANFFISILFLILRLLPYMLVLVIGLGLILMIITGFTLLPHYNSLKQVYSSASEGQIHLEAAEKFVGEQKFDLATLELTAAEENFNLARQSLGSLETSPIIKNDYFGDQYEVAQDVLFIGEKLSASLQKITSIGDQAIKIVKKDNTSFIDITPETKGEILGVLMRSTNDLKDVRRDFAVIRNKLTEINKKQPLFIFNKAIDPLQTRIPKIEKTFDTALTVMKVLPAFAGYPEERTYLFILENNREMRPSGGFIGTYGILKIENAEIKTFFTDNSYNLDVLVQDDWELESPEPMKKYMNQPKWFFRDANWWPDWPTSAQKIEWFYEAEGGTEKVDGVIAITSTVIEELLGVLGDFTVGGLTFNQENFWEQLQYQVEFGYYKQGIATEDRKDIIGELGKQIMSRLYSLPLSKWPALVDLVATQTEEKHILLYFNNPAMQQTALGNGWAGEVKDYRGDYIMLVDANLAALKTDSVMDRTMVYKLKQNENGDLLAEVRVNYQNNGAFTWKTTRYRTYTRLYVPEGSELISIQAGKKVYDQKEIDKYGEFAKTAFGVFFEVEPQASKEVVWTYKLPQPIGEMIKAGQYSLLIQKQPGIPKMNLQLDFSFSDEILRQESIDYKVDNLNLKHTEVIRADQEYNIWFK